MKWDLWGFFRFLLLVPFFFFVFCPSPVSSIRPWCTSIFTSLLEEVKNYKKCILSWWVWWVAACLSSYGVSDSFCGRLFSTKSIILYTPLPVFIDFFSFHLVWIARPLHPFTRERFIYWRQTHFAFWKRAWFNSRITSHCFSNHDWKRYFPGDAWYYHSWARDLQIPLQMKVGTIGSIGSLTILESELSAVPVILEEWLCLTDVTERITYLWTDWNADGIPVNVIIGGLVKYIFVYSLSPLITCMCLIPYHLSHACTHSHQIYCFTPTKPAPHVPTTNPSHACTHGHQTHCSVPTSTYPTPTAVTHPISPIPCMHP